MHPDKLPPWPVKDALAALTVKLFIQSLSLHTRNGTQGSTGAHSQRTAGEWTPLHRTGGPHLLGFDGMTEAGAEGLVVVMMRRRMLKVGV